MNLLVCLERLQTNEIDCGAYCLCHFWAVLRLLKFQVMDLNFDDKNLGYVFRGFIKTRSSIHFDGFDIVKK